ncbi:WD40 repeat domain-containing protein [Nostoc sp.]|uniref:WD40 repeat domain-containing protein n=1 Tax=Nostoc sp. TaxID=1180 RepID=UPI002FF7E167
MLDNWLSKKQICLLRGVAVLIFLAQIGAFVWGSYRAMNICKLSQPHSPYCDLTVVQTLTGEASAIALGADGHTLVSSSNKTITVWHLPNQQPQLTLQGHTNNIYDLALDTDGKTLVSGSFDKTIKVWNLATGKLKFTLKGHSEAVNAVVITPDQQTVVSASYDKTIKVWNLATGQLRNTLAETPDALIVLALSPNGQTLISGDSGDHITLWDLATGQKGITLNAHYGTISALAISRNGKLLASGSAKQVKLWNLATGELLQDFEGFYFPQITIAFSPDGQSLIAGGGYKPYRIWNLTTGNIEATLAKDSNWSGAMVFSRDGKTLITGTQDGITVWRFAAPSNRVDHARNEKNLDDFTASRNIIKARFFPA